MTAVAVLMALAPGVAQAATVSVTGAPGSQDLIYAAAAGEVNQVFVGVPMPGTATVRHLNDLPITAGAGCAAVDGAASPTVTCQVQPGLDIGIALGDLADVVSGDSPFPTFIDAGTGDDRMLAAGFDGSTAFVGGAGRDRLLYSERQQPVSITLDGVANDGGFAEADAVADDIEVLEGGGDDDLIEGDDGAQELHGGFGVDLLGGAGGDDLLVGGGGCGDALSGGGGNDVLRPASGGCGTGSDVQGGGGHDRLELTSFSGGYVVSLDDDATDGDLDYALLDNFHSDIEDVTGSQQADLLIGSDAGNVLDGAGGDDLLDGAGGPDDLRGGAGEDVADYSVRNERVFLSLDDSQNDGEAGEQDVLRDDIEHLVGGNHHDELSGSAADNALDGGPGADVLRGNGGLDVADYGLRTATVEVDLDGAQGDDGQSGEGDTVGADVEGVIGGTAGDILTGNAAGGVLVGGGGSDRISDPGGEDLIDAGEGNDRILARDHARDLVLCGPQQDRVDADETDQLDECETSETFPTGGPNPPTPPALQRPDVPRIPRPPVVPAPDTKAPRAAFLARTGFDLVTTLRRTALSVRVGCDEMCTATVSLRSTGPTTRSLRKRRLRGSTTVAKGAATRANTLHTIRLRPSKLGARKLRALRRGRYQLIAVVKDAAGNTTTVRRTVTVLR